MKIYTKGRNNGEFIEIGECKEISNEADVLFFRIYARICKADRDVFAKELEAKTGRKCIIGDLGLDLSHVE